MTAPCIWESLRCEIKNLSAEGNKINLKLLVSTRREKSCPLLTCPLGCNSGILKADMEFKTPMWWPLRPSYWRLLCVFVSGETSTATREVSSPSAFILHFFVPAVFWVWFIAASKAESSSAFTTIPFLLKRVQQWAWLRRYIVYQFKIWWCKMYTIVLKVICICNRLGECCV